MAMRELVTGAAACAVPGSSSSSSNPLGALANALIGSSSKPLEGLKEIPTSTTTATEHPLYQDATAEDRLRGLPGADFDHSFSQHPTSQGSEFLRRFRTSDQNGFANAWDEIQRSGPPPPPALLDHGLPPPQLQPTLDGPPQRVLSNFLHSFVGSSHGGIPFRPAPLPALGLSEGDKQCIRDRSSIMARHFFADKSEDFINTQVNALLSSLDIDGDVRVKGPLPGRFQELEDYWNESQAARRPGPPQADGWVTEFSQHRIDHGDPNVWAHSFEQQHGANGWASEFEQEQLISAADQMGGANISNLSTMEQTRMLAHTLAQNNDPKFQNSKFLQFVSKMSRGELIIDDNQVKPAVLSSPGDWATEYQQQYSGGRWADEYARDQLSHGPDQWANEFAAEREQSRPVDDKWVNEFSKLHVDDWADEFGRQVGEGAFGESSTDNWADTYDEYLNEQVVAKQKPDASRGVYVFTDMNPYVGHPNPLKEGQDLFRKGLLSEAVLALEAEVLKNPDNAEGWRLLGIAHAENDDDQQAIAAMMRAHEADPTNLEVLLALGVSHTNEFEQAAALKYLYGWLQHHQKYRTLATPELSDSLYYANVARLFNEAAQMAPEDADVHIVLGVLYNLSREYDKAIAFFQTALKLKPQDYSLWNKLGATQANSVQSADAILAYQQALDLKPNYVRAWANMGISYANQGMYEDSIRYYVRALAMNPKADNAWQYLRISLSFASRNDMVEACDSRNLDALQKEFPL
ncbi:peroxisome biogenesis protein 5-like isoform X1 [Populus nigra]|uniref:peroxisome biogenesis protein 5-like isoform X1 n=1 Tax=Populus nigra TaxID=3691 RepID=UPI002B266CF8|nr:peroxisome biogenesis protein 5-like isoform X1 [Populus nigra]